MIVAIDTETYEFNQSSGEYEPVLNARKFTLGCVKTDTGKTEFFENPDDMKDYLLQLIEKNISYKKRTFIYAHNMEYDWYAVFKNNLLLEDNKYIIFNPFISIYKYKAYFLDTMAFYRMDLKSVGEILDLPKMDLPNNPTSMEEVKPYLERDTDIVLQAILSLKKDISELGFNPRKLLTAGQLSMTSFLTYCNRNGTKKLFMEFVPEKKMWRVIPSKNEDDSRPAFRGANTTAFKIGKFDWGTCVDINSLYPYAMTKMPFPNLRSEKKFDKPSIDQLKEWVTRYIGVARCTVKAPMTTKPYLPIRYGRTLHFPSNKTMRGTWTFLEIEKAISLGYEILNVEYAITWMKSPLNPLRPFIRELYSYRKKSKGNKKLVVKLIMNNLYGKFSQNKHNKDIKYVNRGDVSSFLEEGYQIQSSYEDKYIISKDDDSYVPSYVNPIISTYITAYARNYLWDHLNLISSEDLLYCDTDSIIMQNFDKYKKHFPISEELGEWKIEKEGPVKILGEKRYYVGDDVRISGTPKRIINEKVEIESDGIVSTKKKGITIIDNEEDIEIMKMVSLKEAMTSGLFNKVGTFRNEITEMKPHNKQMVALPDHIDEVDKHGDLLY